MTQQEFNEKYKAFLEEGFEDQGLEFDIPEVTSFLNEAFGDLTRIPGFNYAQIKLKFDMPRCYTNASRAMNNMIETRIKEIMEFNEALKE